MSLSSSEKRYTSILAAIYGFRLLGLFMIFPVFSVYAHHLIGSTAFLVGLAFGIYGLFQACLQIPLGMLSDYIGRKPVIVVGLSIFLLGSIVAAVSNTITGVFIGRALQGAGAIGSTLTAMLADVVREEYRSKALAWVGITIALSFVVAMMLAPWMAHWIGVSGIFLLTAILAIIGILMTLGFLPTKIAPHRHPEAELAAKFLPAILFNPQLLCLDLGIFCLHAILTTSFIAIPLLLAQVLHFSLNQQGILYAVVLILAFIVVMPLMRFSEKAQKLKFSMLLMIALLCVVEALFAQLPLTSVSLSVLMFFFFIAFIFLEASLPSWVAKIAPLAKRGTAMGIYSTAQFLGIFAGGTVGGYLNHQGNLQSLFIFSMILGMVWFVITFGVMNTVTKRGKTDV